MRLSALTARLQALKVPNATLLVAIDGRGGSGKSTLAQQLADQIEATTIVHLDDFAYPMGGADRQRLLADVILPLKQNRPVRYQARDFQTKQLTDWREIQLGGIVIVEGVLTLHDLLYRHYDFRIWIEVPTEIAFQRGLARDKTVYGVDTTREWTEVWIPEENAAIAEQNPRSKADYEVDWPPDSASG